MLSLLCGFLVYGVAVHRVIDAPHLSSLLATFSVNMMIIGVGTAVFLPVGCPCFALALILIIGLIHVIILPGHRP